MLSIYRDSSGKTLVDVSDCESITEVKTVKMMNLGLTDFDQQMFCQMMNVEEMDISGNKLDTIPEYISLPKLKRLNCSRNRFSDVSFVRQFPNLEEMDIRYNRVAFSDHCIACELCPNLKRINDQEINIEKLKEKLESRLRPLISKVWQDHFMHASNETVTSEEFEAIGEKFRTMLQHSNIAVTKLVLKFKNFKLNQLIDNFLAKVRESSSLDTPTRQSGRSRRNYPGKKPGDPKSDDIEFVPVEVPSSAPDDVPREGLRAIAVGSDPEKPENTVYYLSTDDEAFSLNSDTVYILTDDGEDPEASKVMILTENGKVAENSERDLSGQDGNPGSQVPNPGSKDPGSRDSVPQNSASEGDPAPETDTRVTKFLPGPLSWDNPVPPEKRQNGNPEAPESKEAAPQPESTQKADEAPPQSKMAADSAPKVVKYWLYDEECKPLKRANKPVQKRPKKRINLAQYIVGPASEYSLVNKRPAAAPNGAAEPEYPAVAPQAEITTELGMAVAVLADLENDAVMEAAPSDQDEIVVEMVIDDANAAQCHGNYAENSCEVPPKKRVRFVDDVPDPGDGERRFDEGYAAAKKLLAESL